MERLTIGGIMDKDIEGKIVSAFFVDIKKERALFELSSLKKRKYFIWGIHRYLDKRYVQKITQSVDSYQIIYDILKGYGAPKDCYMMEVNDENDGKFVSLEYALKKAVHYGPALISCIHGKLAYVEGEPGIGAPDRYLLIRE